MNGVAESTSQDTSTMTFAEGGEPLSPADLARKASQSLEGKGDEGGAPPEEPTGEAPAPVDTDSLIPGDVLGEPAPEEPASADIPEPEGLTEQSAKAFKQMREKIDAMAEQLKGRSEEAQSNADVEGLQKQLAEANAKIAQFDLTQDPSFKNQYTLPLQMTHKQIQETVKQFGGEADWAKRLVGMDMKQRASFLAENLPDAASLLNVQLSNFDVQYQSRAQAMQNHSTTRQRIEAQNSANNQRLADESFSSALLALRGEGHHVLHESASNADWTQAVNQRIDLAKTFMGAENVQDKATIALRAAMADGYKNLVNQQQDQIRALRADLAKYRQAEPGLGQSSSTTESAGAPDTGQHDRSAPMSGSDITAALRARFGKSKK